LKNGWFKRIYFIKMAEFARKFFDEEDIFTFIGRGSPGGKAQGLIHILSIINTNFDFSKFKELSVCIPRMTVITTDLFDEFMKLNNLYEIAYSDESDEIIAHAFQNTSLPPVLVGDLYALIAKVKSPLAIRSSSLLEDSLEEPFAGVYATKMISNNQFDTETRFRKLLEAIKFVYASAFFQNAKDYFRAINKNIAQEKMAIIIQEVVGSRHDDRFYPDISGVARSYNYYSTGYARPEDGIVSLALGLGRTIVDEGISWDFSPSYPKASPPFNNMNELLNNTQRNFWAINMGHIPIYDPVKETEYLVQSDLKVAEADGTLHLLTSTYDPQADLLYPGLVPNGPRVVNFSPIVKMNRIPLVSLIIDLLEISEKSYKTAIEIEFAMVLESKSGLPARFGFLQVRPMLVTQERIDIDFSEMKGDKTLVASKNVLGNGLSEVIYNVVYVKPDAFEAQVTKAIAKEVSQINQKLVTTKEPYLLIGFGRWGSVDPWLGIPINWGQVSGAKVIVEATLPEMNVDLSQGTHFFHNMVNFKVYYFSVHHSGDYQIDWPWLDSQKIIEETTYIKHIKLAHPLKVKVDGRTGKGVILK
jgi:hypothetical protein